MPLNLYRVTRFAIILVQVITCQRKFTVIVHANKRPLPLNLYHMTASAIILVHATTCEHGLIVIVHAKRMTVVTEFVSHDYIRDYTCPRKNLYLRAQSHCNSNGVHVNCMVV